MSRQLSMLPHISRSGPRDVRNVNDFSQLVSYSDEMIEAAGIFDRTMGRITIDICRNCSRKFPDLKVNEYNQCSSCQKNPTKFSASNKMDPGAVPEELQNLTYIEQILIAQIHPIVLFHRTSDGQYTYEGSVINVWQDISSYCTVLPHDPNLLRDRTVFHNETRAGAADFQANATKIRSALIWLKDNNIYYKYISISENNLRIIQENGDLNRFRQQNSEQDISNSFSGSANSLVDPLFHEGFLARAFPCLFPFGIADYGEPRTQSLSCDEYFKFLMEYHDRRFARDPRFRFIAMKSIMSRQAQASIESFLMQSNLLEANVQELRQRIDPLQMMEYCTGLMSTPSYWRARLRELNEMVEQLGSPSVFFTLSAADFYWPDLFRLLDPQSNVSQLTWRQRGDLLQENPLITSWFFQRRCQVFLEYVLKPIFGLADYWYRFEWQKRGSPHIHGVMWLRDCPKLNIENISDTEITAIIQYFEDMCVAINPSLGGNDSGAHPSQKRFSDVIESNKLRDLGHLINKFQRHVCGQQCERNPEQQCRFDFPKEMQERAHISADNGYLEFIPKRNDERVVKYNPLITQLWRANTDFAPVISHEPILKYITKFPSNTSMSPEDYLRTQTDNSSAKIAIQNFVMSSLSDRKYSACEVMHIIMGYSLYNSSRIMSTFTTRDEE